MNEQDLGEIVRDGDLVGLRFVRHYPHPIQRVWRAITESDQLRAWFPCDIVGNGLRARRSPASSGRRMSRSTRSRIRCSPVRSRSGSRHGSSSGPGAATSSASSWTARNRRRPRSP